MDVNSSCYYTAYISRNSTIPCLAAAALTSHLIRIIIESSGLSQYCYSIVDCKTIIQYTLMEWFVSYVLHNIDFQHFQLKSGFTINNITD